MKTVLISGSLAFDSIMDFGGKFSDHILPDKIHNINVSFVVDNLTQQYGGNAGNISYTLALLGERPTLIASAGKDFAEYRQHLERAGVDVDLIRQFNDIATARATIMTDWADNQITAFYPGAMREPASDSIDSLPPAAVALIAPGNPVDMTRLAQHYRDTNTAYVFDPGQQITSLSADELRAGIDGSDILICNDYELELIKSKTNLDEEGIMALTKHLITTLGEQGSTLRTRKDRIAILPARVSNVVDPTGAGDAYRAGLLKGILEGLELATACEFASVIAAYAIESFGAQGHKVSYEMAAERYRQVFHHAIV